MNNTSDVNYEGRIKELTGRLEAVTRRYHSAIEDVKQLTSVKVFGFLYDKKYPIEETEVGLRFAINDSVYQIITSQLPFLTIRAAFQIEHHKINQFAAAAKKVTESKHMIKAYVFDNMLIVDLQSYEVDCRHFFHSFIDYLRLIDIACGEIAMYLD